MKLDKLFDVDLLTGVAIGALIGLYFPMESYKAILVVVLAVVIGSKVITTK